MSLPMSVCTPVYPYPLPISPYSTYTPFVPMPSVCLTKAPTCIPYSPFQCSHDSFLYTHTLTLYAYATLMFLRYLSCLHAVHMPHATSIYPHAASLCSTPLYVCLCSISELPIPFPISSKINHFVSFGFQGIIFYHFEKFNSNQVNTDGTVTFEPKNIGNWLKAVCL